MMRIAGRIERERVMSTRASRGYRRRNPLERGRGLMLATLLALGMGLAAQRAAADAPKVFPTPEAAAQALIDTAKTGDTPAVLAILGSAAKDLVSSGDEVQDQEAAKRFATLAQQMMQVEKTGEDVEIMSIGAEEWPFPIPIVRTGSGWAFDTLAGKQELLNRRIGANELDAIEVCRAYVNAQRAYLGETHDGTGVIKYAERVISSPGKHDGLYWPAVNGEEASPLGPLIADAEEEGYNKKGAPYHGYYYRILTAQGKDAPGGAYSYVINGNMVAGFALVAYPAQYGSSGVMTFIVNQEGVVYQKDLGLKTDAIAKAIKTYNPDPSWQKVD
jgi:hypothetical protein